MRSSRNEIETIRAGFKPAEPSVQGNALSLSRPPTSRAESFEFNDVTIANCKVISVQKNGTARRNSIFMNCLLMREFAIISGRLRLPFPCRALSRESVIVPVIQLGKQDKD